MPGSFADASILLYLVVEGSSKADIAEGVLRRNLTISVQVLNEAANVLRRKHQADWASVYEVIGILRAAARVVPLTIETHELGLRVAQRHRFSVYDGMIVASALLADCDTLYSEDMHAGLLVEGRLRIVDPFRGS